MGDVVRWNGITRHELNSEDMLTAIAAEKPDKVFVITWPEDGSMPSFHSNTQDIPVVLMQLQRFIHKFYNGDFS